MDTITLDKETFLALRELVNDLFDYADQNGRYEDSEIKMADSEEENAEYQRERDAACLLLDKIREV